MDRPWSSSLASLPEGERAPGALLVFAGGRPTCIALPLRGGRLLLGRTILAAEGPRDALMSRRHVALELLDDIWTIEDLGSHNGTFVNGRPIDGISTACAGAVLRAGESIFLLADDLRPFVESPVELRAGEVVGPELRACQQKIAAAAERRQVVHLVGEPGSGKERAARQVHQLLHPEAPFVAVSSTADEVALSASIERAAGGTLFLDGAGAPAPAVRARLQRICEEGRFTLCTDGPGLGGEIVVVPPLRARRADVPWLVRALLNEQGDAHDLHTSLIESALLRPWLENVRELGRQLRLAASVADGDGRRCLRGPDLEPETRPMTSWTARQQPPTREEIFLAVERLGGDLDRAARELALHVGQLRRLMRRLALEVAA